MIKKSELPGVIFKFMISAIRIIGLSFTVVLLTLIIFITYAKSTGKICHLNLKVTTGNSASEIYTGPDNSK
ncbi:hypothetical protein TUM12151_17470 [Morganella morganii]|nr:hypothetical protein TUM12149_24200 [Morganella morganii]GIZ32929.1 hypothetical protein TUM12150_34150 [Morganella morganii]GIZ34761.1 hypothetical protein TUM12151_17470 [Morganella morganii]